MATFSKISEGVTAMMEGNLPFPATQVASADANALDDYEEGTWTPVIGGLTSTSGQTYSIQNGYYTKVGRLVTCYFYATLSNKGTITGTLGLTGLPFTSANLTNGIAAVALARVEQWTLPANHVLCLHIGNNGTAGTFTMYDATGSAAGSDVLGSGNVNNNTSLIGQFSYFTD